MINMDIYLHIGTEKTGSSFLQSLLAINRQHLKENKFYYPKGGKYEKLMQAGSISPGNGKDLYLALQANNLNSVENLLSIYKEQTNEKECTKLLISNENLIEVLSDKLRLQNFLKICKKLDFNYPRILLVLRNPADQALSLFKHRAKAGNIPSMQEWFPKGYMLPVHLSNFQMNIKEFELNILVKKYKKNSFHMSDIFFNQWLKIDIPPLNISKAINPSLTLSELELLKIIKTKDPNMVHFVYNRLLEIPFNEKSKDTEMNDMHISISENIVTQYYEIWELYNQILPDSEKLFIPTKENLNHIDDNSDISLNFSPKQMKEIVGILGNKQNISFKWMQYKRNMRIYFSRILQKIK